ncbi:MAG: selenocysteine-specific translation elongation factor [Bacillota bacterium]|nr:selenocysteine-specific translation elongation factor [Bacillota bacterium]MDW7677435.1 selenocysteine-specific translation elongation factor [Bacillota bacterium]
MKHLIIGTAGHIDHGKTTLIHALTGRNTDRLKEEQKRGISIELGFTYFDLPDGRRAGIIDVPGHEKFIRHMLAGVGGMDLVMLVVAADEGVMPQTREHLDILSMLSIKKGLVVITKASLADPDWLELVKEDIAMTVDGTFLEDCPMLTVDSVSGQGIPELIDHLAQEYDEIEARDQEASCRLPIDRVFTITGFGTVITGTLLEGTVSTEDTLEIFPEEVTARVRNIQVHGETVNRAYAGQRVAINLSGLKKDQINRGSFLAKPGTMTDTMMVDCRVTMLKNAPRPLKQRDRVRIYHGTSEIFARVVILEKETIEPGESAFVQFRLEEKAAFKKEDKLILRFYSPMETLGGAVVIEPNPSKHKVLRQDVIDELEAKETGGPEVYLEQQLIRYSNDIPDAAQLSKHTGYPSDQTIELLKMLVEDQKVYSISDQGYVHWKFHETVTDKAVDILSRYHKEFPLRKGISKEELKNRVFPPGKPRLVEAWMDQLEEEGLLRSEGTTVALTSFRIKITPQQQQIMSAIEEAFLKELFAPPRLEELPDMIRQHQKNIQQVLEMMMGETLIRVNQDTVFHEKAVAEARERIHQYFSTHTELTLADFRDLLKTSRKYAVSLLEYFDQMRLTRRQGDNRVLHQK